MLSLHQPLQIDEFNKEKRFTLFSTVAQLLEYGEIKYSKILLDLGGEEKKSLFSMQNQTHYSKLILNGSFQK